MKEDMKYLKGKIYEMKKEALAMALRAGKTGSHLGGGFSCMEIMAVLYLKIMDLKKDRFFIGKAHAVLAYYTALQQAGYLKQSDLLEFEQNGSILPGHPLRNIEKGIYYSGGSLGMAFSVAVGSALHLKKTDPKAKVYVLLGDGECQEGSIWEAVMAAAHFGLSNMVCIIDKNDLQYDGSTKSILGIQDFSKRFRAFNWDSVSVNGHCIEELVKALSISQTGKPLLIEANTKKGNGISFMENNLEYHHNVLTHEQYELALQELSKEYE
ncbi:transketolase [Clostridiales bacterium COT073_COT-073]|nr:transketolase [Clostridiales bacterium COT073_COT-073]